MPCPDEYIGLMMVRAGLCSAPRWTEMSRIDQKIQVLMLDIEADYAPEVQH